MNFSIWTKASKLFVDYKSLPFLNWGVYDVFSKLYVEILLVLHKTQCSLIVLFQIYLCIFETTVAVLEICSFNQMKARCIIKI